jgi:hypothetical protein
MLHVCDRAGQRGKRRPQLLTTGDVKVNSRRN